MMYFYYLKDIHLSPVCQKLYPLFFQVVNFVMQDVLKHMGESLELMFECFKIISENQQYQLEVLDKVKDTFPLKLEMKKFPNDKAKIDNFKREGHVPGGGCVKFFRKLF